MYQRLSSILILICILTMKSELWFFSCIFILWIVRMPRCASTTLSNTAYPLQFAQFIYLSISKNDIHSSSSIFYTFLYQIPNFYSYSKTPHQKTTYCLADIRILMCELMFFTIDGCKSFLAFDPANFLAFLCDTQMWISKGFECGLWS